jgi:hypothetical protein
MILKTQQFIIRTILRNFQQQYQPEVNHDLVLMAFGYTKHYKPLSVYISQATEVLV